MTEHLGRNPFAKKNLAAVPDSKVEPEKIRKKDSKQSVMRWLTVDVPAQSIVFAIKTILFAKSFIK